MELEQVEIKRVIGPTPSGAAVLLGNDKKTFVVFVGYFEAAAIVREMNHETPPRPLTHELIQAVFLGFDVSVKQIIISTIIENTFCATLILEQNLPKNANADWAPKRNEVRIDARPSDCLVLALKNNAQIYVTKEVFEQVQDVSHLTTGGDANADFSKISMDFDLNPLTSTKPSEPSEPVAAVELPDFELGEDAELAGDLKDVFGFNPENLENPENPENPDDEPNPSEGEDSGGKKRK